MFFATETSSICILYCLLAGGVNIEGEDDSYDFGSGAGFYVDATETKWKNNYRMYSYITKEVQVLPIVNPCHAE